MMQEFDDRFRETFSGYSPEVPPHIWENIAAKKKKRRFFLWFWIGQYKYGLLLLGIITTVALWYLNADDFKERVKTGKAINIINSDPASGKGTESAEIGLDPNNQSAVRNSTALQESESKTDDKNIMPDESREPEIVSAINMQPNHANAEETNKAYKLDKKAPLTGARNKSFNLSSALTSNDKNSNLKPLTIGKTTRIDQLPVSAVEKSEIPVFGFLENVPGKFNFPERQATRMPLTGLVPMQFGRPEIPCPENTRGSGTKYIEWYAGPDMVFRSLSDTGQSDYLRKRRESANPSLSFSLGGRFTRVFNNGVSVRTGINYSQINEKFSVQEGNVLQLIYIFNDNGDTVGSYYTRGNLYRKSRNKYHSLDIPLLAGYEFGTGRFRYNINAGVIVNVYSWQRGLIVDTSGKVVNMSTGSAVSPYGFKTNAGIGFLASGSFYYKLNEKLYFLAEPYIRYNLSALNEEELSLKQKFHAAGIRFGIRKELK